MRICPICDTLTEEERCPKDGYMTIDIDQFRTGAHKDPNIGRVLKKQYRIVDLLGQGGMGSVYKGVNIPLRQDVAIKIMDPIVRKNLEQVKRFHVEALATSRLKHPNTVRVFDFGQEGDGTIFLVMEFLEGRSLEAVLLNEGRFGVGRALNISRMIMGSLAEAHSLGIVHRDLKPSNIMMIDMPGAHDFIKVVDFGIAKVLDEGVGMEKGLTKTGVIVGSPEYMSPEQIAGKKVDARSDLYSLGLVMYRTLTGKLPFTGATPITVMMKQGTEPLPPFPEEVRKEAVPGLETLIQKMTEKDPDKRPVSAREVLDALDKLVSQTTTGFKSRPVLGNPSFNPSVDVHTRSKPTTVDRPKKHSHEAPTAIFEPEWNDSGPMDAPDKFVVKKGFPWVILVVLAIAISGGVVFWSLHRKSKVTRLPSRATKIRKKGPIGIKHEKKAVSSVPVTTGIQRTRTVKAAKTQSNPKAGQPDTGRRQSAGAEPLPKRPEQKKTVAKSTRTISAVATKTVPSGGKNTPVNKPKTNQRMVRHGKKPAVTFTRVVLNSYPKGASVWVRGRKVGTTPGVIVRVPRGKTVFAVIKKMGYRTVKIRLDSRKRHVKIRLEPDLF